MFSNVGKSDRVIRFLLAGAMLYGGLSVYQGTNWGIGLDIGAVVLALSAAFGFCGIYRLLGISTCNCKDRPPA